MDLYRSKDKVVFGVCAGIAEKFGLGAGLVRVITLVAAIVTGSIVGWIYLVLGLVLPVRK